MSKQDCLAKLTNSHGKITIAALDHRGSLKASLHPENPDLTSDAEIHAWKRQMIELYKHDVSGILIDPIYGANFVRRDDSVGWMLSMEKTGYRGGKEARTTEILPDWSVKQAKEMGASGVKLLLYYDPENIVLAREQKGLARRIGEECIQHDLVFLLEPLSYNVQGGREQEVLRIARDLKDLPVDIFKFEYPGSAQACQHITSLLSVPWVLLSAGMEYEVYKQALKIAMTAGAAGFAVGRAVWQEFGHYHGKAREEYFTQVTQPRMRELVEIANSTTSAPNPHFKTLDQAQVQGKRVVVRVDWNVTLGKALQIVDDTRIVRTLPTIKWLLDQGASQIVLLSHLGKPRGVDPNFSLKPVVNYASKLLGQPIQLAQNVTEVSLAQPLVMLENLRFSPGEESNDPEFSRQLAGLGDLYVNEAFGESHRSVASIVGIPHYLPSYAGLWFSDEVETILRVLNNAEHPFVVVMGGAKVQDKSQLLEVLSQRADVILLGGKLANEYVQQGMRVSGKAAIRLPLEGSNLLDIGPHTQAAYTAEIKQAKTVVWNGPMGKVEELAYRAGTEAIFKAISANVGAYTLVGGGDTLAALNHEDDLARIDHVSTGGGAMLKLLESGSLVGIEALLNDRIAA